MIWTGLLLALGIAVQGTLPLLPVDGSGPDPLFRIEGAGTSQTSGAQVLVTPEWLEANLNTPGLVILHASSNGSDYEAGHIPGALLILGSQIYREGTAGVGAELRGWREIRSALEEVGVSNRSTVVVYGSSTMMAARLWMTLDVAGVGNPLFLDGGLQLWTEEERPLTTSIPQVARGRVIVQPHDYRLTEAEWILARLGHENLALLDARSDDEFTGADGGGGGRFNPGHVPGARHLNWEELIESRERPVFLPLNQLQDKFVAAGADPRDLVVTYCLSGVRASVVYMIGRLLGYDTHLYDGSWQDWGSRDYPTISIGGGR